MIGHVFKIVRNSWKSFCGIFIEQMVVCVVLMLVVISVFVTLSKMYSPGLLDTDNMFVSVSCLGMKSVIKKGR